MTAFDQLRTQALTVPCPYCPADPGQGCVVPDGRGGFQPLTHLPAHGSRIRAAQAVSNDG